MPENLKALQQNAARNLVTKYLKVKPGESVIVESWPHTMPMSSAVVDEVRRAGGIPLQLHEDEGAFWNAVDRKQTKLLGTMSKSEWAAMKSADVYVMFWGPGDLVRSRKMSPDVEEQVFAWNGPWYEAAKKAGLRGIRMGVGFATDTRAAEWKTSVDKLTRQLLLAGTADPQKMLQDGKRLQRSLKPGRKVQIRHPNGTDLEVALGKVAPRVYAGVWENSSKNSPFDILMNYPEGRVLAALDGKTAEGTIVANRPSFSPMGTARGGRFEFHDGKLTSFTYGEGEGPIRARYGKAKPGKDRTGSIYIGLNPLVEDVPNLEDMERGIICVTVGNNSNSGGSNKSDFMAWIALAGSEISVDGTPVIRGGKIL